MTAFAPDVVRAVTAHMNDDHRADNVLIVQAFVDAAASDAEMVDLDVTGGTWAYEAEGERKEAHVTWPVPVESRADIRKAVVLLYRDACRELGVEPRQHG